MHIPKISVGNRSDRGVNVDARVAGWRCSKSKSMREETKSKLQTLFAPYRDGKVSRVGYFIGVNNPPNLCKRTLSLRPQDILLCSFVRATERLYHGRL